jgi:uncharacterized membrane protein
LNHLAAATVTVNATSTKSGQTAHVHVQLKNTGNNVALENKLTLLNATGGRILPAYYSDNYVSLLPGESKEIDIEYPASAGMGAAQVAIRGWNAVPQKVAVQ